MNHKEQISAWVDAHREAFLEDVKTLCRIDSSKGAAEPGKPFGDGPYRALLAAEEMLKGYGLATKNYENYVLAADLGEGERELDILAHLDVVPGQGDWTVTEAFEPIEKDGVLYGRGVADDKGPAVAALYPAPSRRTRSTRWSTWRRADSQVSFPSTLPRRRAARASSR